MYKEQRNALDVVIPAGALAALAGFAFKFDVLEDNMHVELGFQGTLVAGVQADLQLALGLLDDLGAAVADLQADATGATPYAADPVYTQPVFIATEYDNVSVKRVFRLNRGTYLCSLHTACDVADAQIQGAEVISRLSAKTLSNHNTVAANSNLKRQGQF